MPAAFTDFMTVLQNLLNKTVPYFTLGSQMWTD